MLGPTSPIEREMRRRAMMPGGNSLVWALSARVLVAAAAVLLVLLALTSSHRPQPPAGTPTRASHGLELLPIGALGAVSGVVGAGDRAYRVERVGQGEFAARSAGMRAVFGRLGVGVAAGATRLRLRPLAVSAGAASERLAPVSPRAHANEVSYVYPSLRAWYRNGPAGIEQGFVLNRAPLGANRHS